MILSNGEVLNPTFNCFQHCNQMLDVNVVPFASDFRFGKQKVHSFRKNEMADKREAVTVLLLNELFDSVDEKPTRGTTKEWILFFILHFQSFFSCFFFVQLKLFPCNSGDESNRHNFFKS